MSIPKIATLAIMSLLVAACLINQPSSSPLTDSSLGALRGANPNQKALTPITYIDCSLHQLTIGPAHPDWNVISPLVSASFCKDFPTSTKACFICENDPDTVLTSQFANGANYQDDRKHNCTGTIWTGTCSNGICKTQYSYGSCQGHIYLVKKQPIPPPGD